MSNSVLYDHSLCTLNCNLIIMNYHIKHDKCIYSFIIQCAYIVLLALFGKVFFWLHLNLSKFPNSINRVPFYSTPVSTLDRSHSRCKLALDLGSSGEATDVHFQGSVSSYCRCSLKTQREYGSGSKVLQVSSSAYWCWGAFEDFARLRQSTLRLMLKRR